MTFNKADKIRGAYDRGKADGIAQQINAGTTAIVRARSEGREQAAALLDADAAAARMDVVACHDRDCPSCVAARVAACALESAATRIRALVQR